MLEVLKKISWPAEPVPWAQDWQRVRRPEVARDFALTGTTRRWLQRLPARRRPYRLCTAFPRVANRIAWVWPGSISGQVTRLAAFRAGMAENGFVEGQHFQLDLRYADGRYERFPTLMAEALAGQPAILMVVTIASVHAAQQATRTVPIILDRRAHV